MSIDSLRKEYDLNYSLYSSLIREVVHEINILLISNDIKIGFPIESRVKEWGSILEKLNRKELSIRSIAELKDLAGIRIVVLFKEDIEKVCKVLENNFEILNKDDTNSRLLENQFGYGSIHYELKLKTSWSEVPSFLKLKDLQVEIQVRSAAQHIWATASHLLQYKKEQHVPPPVRRSINRVAAILETVDFEFERVLLERREYNKGPIRSDDTLDIDSLRKVMDDTLPEENKEGSENYAELLDELNYSNIKTVGELKNIISKHINTAKENDKNTVRRALEGDFDEHMPWIREKAKSQNAVMNHEGFIRTILREEYPNYYEEYIKSKNTISHTLK